MVVVSPSSLSDQLSEAQSNSLSGTSQLNTEPSNYFRQYSDMDAAAYLSGKVDDTEGAGDLSDAANQLLGDDSGNLV